MVGYLARSVAGHDKGTLYIIIEETEQYLLVADGRLKTVENPKKKNRKHLQLIKEAHQALSNEAIRRIIKDYRRNVDVESGCH